MSRKDDADAKRAAAREARQQGKSASEAGASTGASKQTSHATHEERGSANAPLHEEKGKS